MARTLPAAITTALASPYQNPTMAVTLQDLQVRFTTLTSGNTDGRSAFLISSTNALLLAYVTQGADPNTVYCKRITSQLNASQWAATGVSVTTNARASAGVAIAQNGATTRIFYQRVTGQLICYRDSTDDGLTWSAESTLPAAPLGVGNFCYGIATDSNGLQIWVTYAAYTNGAPGIYRSAYSAGWSAWANEGPATPQWGITRGFSQLALSGTRYFALGVQMRSYQTGIALGIFAWDGVTYFPISSIQAMDTPNLGLSLPNPTIQLGQDGNYYICSTLIDDGTLSGSPQNRTTIFQSSSPSGPYHPYQQVAQSFPNGAIATVLGTTLFVISPAAVLYAPAPPASSDISTDVFHLAISEVPNAPAALSMTLDNSQGQYNSNISLRADATLTLQLGYDTTLITTHTFRIEDIRLEANADQQLVQITGRNEAKILDYPTTRTIAYTNQTIGFILKDICGQAGLPLATLPATAQFTTVVPCFLITPGETWHHSVARLASIYLFDFFADPTPQLRVIDRAVTDPSTWSYGAELLALSYGTNADQPNMIRVTGTGTQAATFADTIDTANYALTGRERPLVIHDRMIDSAAKARLSASQHLRDAQSSGTSASLTVAMNPAHELFDVITITDTALGITNQKVRIAHIALTIETETGTWSHTLNCIGV